MIMKNCILGVPSCIHVNGISGPLEQQSLDMKNEIKNVRKKGGGLLMYLLG